MTVALTLVLTACGDGGDGNGEAVRLVATTTIFGDVARHLAEGEARVEVLLPVGADPHDFQPSSRDVAAIEGADLVIANGLLLEEGMADVLESAASDGANILEVAERLDPLPFAGSEAADPHVWLDPVRMGDGARAIAAELARLDPATDWPARAEGYAAELGEAHERIEDILAAIPPENRKLVTNHDSLGYLAARYDFEVVGVVFPGGSTLAEPSSAELGELVRTIEEEGVPAIFVETTEPSALAEAVAAELDEEVRVVELFTGSLGEPGSGAETLIGMLTTNAERIAAALS